MYRLELHAREFARRYGVAIDTDASPAPFSTTLAAYGKAWVGVVYRKILFTCGVVSISLDTVAKCLNLRSKPSIKAISWIGRGSSSPPITDQNRDEVLEDWV